MRHLVGEKRSCGGQLAEGLTHHWVSRHHDGTDVARHFEQISSGRRPTPSGGRQVAAAAGGGTWVAGDDDTEDAGGGGVGWRQRLFGEREHGVEKGRHAGGADVVAGEVETEERAVAADERRRLVGSGLAQDVDRQQRVCGRALTVQRRRRTVVRDRRRVDALDASTRQSRLL